MWTDSPRVRTESRRPRPNRRLTSPGTAQDWKGSARRAQGFPLGGIGIPRAGTRLISRRTVRPPAMEYATLVSSYEKIEATTKRLRITDPLAQLFNQVAP